MTVKTFKTSNPQSGFGFMGYIIGLMGILVAASVIVSQYVLPQMQVQKQLTDSVVNQYAMSKARQYVQQRSILTKVYDDQGNYANLRLPNPQDLEPVNTARGVYRLKGMTTQLDTYVLVPGFMAGTNVSSNYANMAQNSLGLVPQLATDATCAQDLFTQEVGTRQGLVGTRIIIDGDEDELTCEDLPDDEFSSATLDASTADITYAGLRTGRVDSTDVLPNDEDGSGNMTVSLPGTCLVEMLDLSDTSPFKTIYRPDMPGAQDYFCWQETDPRFQAAVEGIAEENPNNKVLQLSSGTTVYLSELNVEPSDDFSEGTIDPRPTSFANSPVFEYAEETDPVVEAHLPAQACASDQALTYTGAGFACVADQQATGGLGLGTIELAPVAGGDADIGLGIQLSDSGSGKDVVLALNTLRAAPDGGIVLNKDLATQTISIATTGGGGINQILGDTIGTAAAPGVPDTDVGSIFFGNASSSTLLFRTLSSAKSYLQISNTDNTVDITFDVDEFLGGNGLNVPACGNADTQKLLFVNEAGNPRFECALDRFTEGVTEERDPIYVAALSDSVCDVGQVLTHTGGTVDLPVVTNPNVPAVVTSVPDFECIDNVTDGGDLALTNTGTGEGFLAQVNSETLEVKSLNVDPAFLSLIETDSVVTVDLSPQVKQDLEILTNILNCYDQGGNSWDIDTGTCINIRQRVESAQRVDLTECGAPQDADTCNEPFELTVMFDRPFNHTPHVVVSPADISVKEINGCSIGLTDKVLVEVINVTTSGFTIRGGGSIAKQVAANPGLANCTLAFPNADNLYTKMAVNWLAIDAE